MRKPKKLLPVLIALALALILELLVFNWRAVFSRGGEWSPLPQPEISGDLAESRKLSLSFCDLERDIRWCHIDILVRDENGEPVTTQFEVDLSDEGNSSIYKAGTIAYFPGHNKAAYFHLNSYGQVHQLTLVLRTEEAGCAWTLRAAEINGSVPFRISVPRVLGLFALFLLLWLLRPGSVLYDNRIWNRRRWVKALCVLLLLVLNLGVLYGLARSNRAFNVISDEPNWAHHHQYAQLARALAEGRTWIDSPEQAAELELLGSMADPYNKSARLAVFQENGLNSPWDTAYYKGHLYVYFGVVPVLLTYLPWYLLTGSDLSTVYTAFLSGALAVIGAFVFLRALIRRYFPETPFPVYVLLSLLMGNCTGVLCYALEPSFYVVPIIFSLTFVFFAMALWLSAALRWSQAQGVTGPAEAEGFCFAPPRSSPRPVGVWLRISAGSLCAALVVGCRPQFLVFSVLALPLFWPLVRQEQRRAVTARRMLAFVLPYLAVAIPLMVYNYTRFGSPFDFGANYNLTTNDMPLRGFRLGRLPDGFFAYLLRLPNVELQFPYMQPAPLTPLYLGKTVKESMFGGVLLVFPFLWVLPGARRAAPVLREKRLRWLTVLPLLLALVVVAADTEMAGILWRYTGDFLALLFLSATVVFLALLQRAGAKERSRLLSFLTAAAVLSLLVCLLIAMTSSSLMTRSPEQYYRLKDLLSIA